MNNPRFSASVQERYGLAMELTDPAQAAAYFTALVGSTQKSTGKSRAECEALERSSLGYYAGYYGSDVRERVERLYGATHPFLGPVSQKLPPEEIFRRGMVHGLAETSEQEEYDLLAAFLENPQDQALRDCLTDWYLEHNVDPRYARCFIRAIR